MSLPFASKVFSKYGAPMGRYSDKTITGLVHLRRVPMVDGDYDPGGAYWGGGRGVEPLWCAWNDEATVYFRAADRFDAKAHLDRQALPATCRYYR